MLNPLTLLTNLKGSLNTILVLGGLFVLGYIGIKFYSMDKKIESQAQSLKHKDSELLKKDELYNKTVKAYELSVIEVEQQSYNKALKKELEETLNRVQTQAQEEQKKLLERLSHEKNILCPDKCYSPLSF